MTAKTYGTRDLLIVRDLTLNSGELPSERERLQVLCYERDRNEGKSWYWCTLKQIDTGLYVPYGYATMAEARRILASRNPGWWLSTLVEGATVGKPRFLRKRTVGL